MSPLDCDNQLDPSSDIESWLSEMPAAEINKPLLSATVTQSHQADLDGEFNGITQVEHGHQSVLASDVSRDGDQPQHSVSQDQSLLNGSPEETQKTILASFISDETKRIYTDRMNPATISEISFDDSSFSIIPSSDSDSEFGHHSSTEIQLQKRINDLLKINASVNKRLDEERSRHLQTIEQLRIASNGGISRYPGINPNTITDLALQLTEGGSGVVGIVASGLLDEVTRGGGWSSWDTFSSVDKDTKDEDRATIHGGEDSKVEGVRLIEDGRSPDSYKKGNGLGTYGYQDDLSEEVIDVSLIRSSRLNPGQRLTVLEGVVDLTLQRLESLEIQVKRTTVEGEGI